ncbi:hypothetical protein PC9H_008746 [Pleurotus ostreatus]|uniref:Uncharacterized protein n=1 Tax=Pleurotus ostreatus TaxID=5322 RepID=A0A8H7DRX3_PLEOS|nr:uncharacterized protein PC9H_008746 [Pleurotus ostreatus]KAF7426378.1 hypothetical protein PC9H_008746 [Pleurotus ostreatus]
MSHLSATLPSLATSNMKSCRLNLITLTYNFFFFTPQDPNFLVDGGLVGLGLKYEYAVSMATRRKHDALKSVSENLKGEDALVAQISASLGLKADIKVYIDLKEMWECDYTARDFDDETWGCGHCGAWHVRVPVLEPIFINHVLMKM